MTPAAWIASRMAPGIASRIASSRASELIVHAGLWRGDVTVVSVVVPHDRCQTSVLEAPQRCDQLDFQHGEHDPSPSMRRLYRRLTRRISRRGPDGAFHWQNDVVQGSCARLLIAGDRSPDGTIRLKLTD